MERIDAPAQKLGAVVAWLSRAAQCCAAWMEAKAVGARQDLRPSSRLPVEIESVKEHYLASYGEIMATGATPAMALEEFDKLWIGAHEQ